MFVELERLRVDNREKAKRIAELEAENRRLREALEKIDTKKFLEWLDKEMPDAEASLKLPYSSEPLPDSEPWK